MEEDREIEDGVQLSIDRATSAKNTSRLKDTRTFSLAVGVPLNVYI